MEDINLLIQGAPGHGIVSIRCPLIEGERQIIYTNIYIHTSIHISTSPRRPAILTSVVARDLRLRITLVAPFHSDLFHGPLMIPCCF